MGTPPLYIGIGNMRDRKMKRVKLGQHIVADPEVCHGAPTFVGTRIMVDQVLEMVAAVRPGRKSWQSTETELVALRLLRPCDWRAAHSLRKLQRVVPLEYP